MYKEKERALQSPSKEVHYSFLLFLSRKRAGTGSKKLFTVSFVCLHFILFVCQLDSEAVSLSLSICLLPSLSSSSQRDLCFSIARQSAISYRSHFFLPNFSLQPIFLALFNFPLFLPLNSLLSLWTPSLFSSPLLLWDLFSGLIGLFRRVIMMSGSALSPWSVSTNGVKYAREAASFLGCPTDSKKYHSMVECLRRKSVEEVLSAEPISPSYLSTFGPTIDSATIRGDPLASMMSSETSFADYDLMLGVTKIESYDIFNSQDERDGIDSNRRDRILRTLIRNLFSYRLQVRALSSVSSLSFSLFASWLILLSFYFSLSSSNLAVNSVIRLICLPLLSKASLFPFSSSIPFKRELVTLIWLHTIHSYPCFPLLTLYSSSSTVLSYIASLFSLKHGSQP